MHGYALILQRSYTSLIHVITRAQPSTAPVPKCLGSEVSSHPNDGNEMGVSRPVTLLFMVNDRYYATKILRQPDINLHLDLLSRVSQKPVNKANTTNQKCPISNILNAYRKQIPMADAKNIYEYSGCE